MINTITSNPNPRATPVIRAKYSSIALLPRLTWPCVTCHQGQHTRVSIISTQIAPQLGLSTPLQQAVTTSLSTAPLPSSRVTFPPFPPTSSTYSPSLGMQPPALSPSSSRDQHFEISCTQRFLEFPLLQQLGHCQGCIITPHFASFGGPIIGTTGYPHLRMHHRIH